MIAGLGVDLVDVDHFQGLIDKEDKETLKRMFSAAELASLRPGVHKGEQLAGWFSAKEAVLKALGVGLAPGISWTDIEVSTNPHGAPAVSLNGLPKTIADHLAVEKWLVSISHTETQATATVIALTASS